MCKDQDEVGGGKKFRFHFIPPLVVANIWATALSETHALVSWLARCWVASKGAYARMKAQYRKRGIFDSGSEMRKVAIYDERRA